MNGQTLSPPALFDKPAKQQGSMDAPRSVSSTREGLGRAFSVLVGVHIAHRVDGHFSSRRLPAPALSGECEAHAGSAGHACG
jgi:hypothetical protein